MLVVLSEQALADLDELHAYISEQSFESRADDYIDRIERFLNNLSDFPRRGTAHEEIHPGLRTIGFEGRATIVFSIAEDTITIEGVLYGGRNWQHRFE